MCVQSRLMVKLWEMPRQYGITTWIPVRFGVTPENQAVANRRLPRVLGVPSRLRPFVAAEPLLDARELRPWLPGICQVVTGGVRTDGSVKSARRTATARAGNALLCQRTRCETDNFTPAKSQLFRNDDGGVAADSPGTGHSQSMRHRIQRDASHESQDGDAVRAAYVAQASGVLALRSEAVRPCLQLIFHLRGPHQVIEGVEVTRAEALEHVDKHMGGG